MQLLNSTASPRKLPFGMPLSNWIAVLRYRPAWTVFPSGSNQPWPRRHCSVLAYLHVQKGLVDIAFARRNSRPGYRKPCSSRFPLRLVPWHGDVGDIVDSIAEEEIGDIMLVVPGSTLSLYSAVTLQMFRR